MCRREVTYDVVNECMQTAVLSGYKGEANQDFVIIKIFAYTLAAMHEGKFMKNFPDTIIDYVAGKIACGVCVYFAYADVILVDDIDDVVDDFLNTLFD